MLKIPYSSYLICAVSGGLCTLAFAPFYWGFLGIICPAVLFYNWYNSSAKQAFFYGFSFAFSLFLFGVSWLHISLHIYGGAPLWLAYIAVLGFATGIALQLAFMGWLLAKLTPRGSYHRLWMMPCVWIIYEWMKGWILTGFPWLDIGYSQTVSKLFAYAPLGGVYLVSFVTVCCSIFLLRCFLLSTYRSSVACLLVIWFSSWALDRVSWSENQEKSLMVGVVQGNIPIQQKWELEQYQTIIKKYQTLSAPLLQSSDIDLLVWPETALPISYQQTNDDFWQHLLPKEVGLLTGIIDRPTEDTLYNAAVLRCKNQTKIRQLYRKQHLVPFGEYLPLRFAFQWVLDFLQLPMSDLSAWTDQQMVGCGDVKIGVSICYEDAFTELGRINGQGTNVLINISEDAWFGDSLAPYQRVQMAQMRARELSRPLIRSANTGPSVIIDETGEIVAQTGLFTAATLVKKIHPQKGDTLYQRWGNWVIMFAFFMLVVLCFHSKTQVAKAKTEK